MVTAQMKDKLVFMLIKIIKLNYGYIR
jgi:hypothetical protein